MKTTRRILQLLFLVITIIGVFALRGNAERWCPFGGVEAFYMYLREGDMLCSLGVSNFYILGAVIALALLVRRAFCSYMCPIGTLSEWLQVAGRRLGLKPRRVPYRLDRALALLKYAVLAVVVYITYRAGELLFRGFDPCYALLSRHGEDITAWSYIAAGSIIIASLFLAVPFCRWLCPLAAVFHPFSRFGLTRIKRDAVSCVNCGKCAKVCPMGIRVDALEQVTAARCTSCMECVEVCPTKGKGALTWGPAEMLGRTWPQAVLVAVLLLCVTAAVVASCAYPLPSFVKMRGETPDDVAAVELRIHELTCRGRGTLLWYYLTRDDQQAIDGYLRLEAWPGPEAAPARVIFDPARTDAEAIKLAITEPYFDMTAVVWRPAPFIIEGYDPLGLAVDPD